MPIARKEENYIGYMFQEIEDALCEEDVLEDTNKNTIEDALCEEDETLDERLALIEDVLCELDEKINGGE